jgi:hypothetical protein
VDVSVTAGWETLLAAELGAAATLLGLVFVGVSINLTRIMASGLLVERALEAVVLLLAVLTAATVALVPGQPAAALGAELVVIGLAAWAALIGIQLRARRRLSPGLRFPFALRVVMGQAATVPFVVAGAGLVVGPGGGLYWLVPGLLVAVGWAVLDSWVLLVEILR